MTKTITVGTLSQGEFDQIAGVVRLARERAARAEAARPVTYSEFARVVKLMRECGYLATSQAA